MPFGILSIVFVKFRFASRGPEAICLALVFAFRLRMFIYVSVKPTPFRGGRMSPSIKILTMFSFTKMDEAVQILMYSAEPQDL